MTERVKKIYIKLYENCMGCTKEKLANEFDVTIKTIENTLKPYSDDIKYDKQLKRYRFNSLLPQYIPYKTFYNIFKNSINEKFLREDFFTIDKLINETNDLFMIETFSLSEFSKKIIMFTIALNDNCVLKVEYTGNAKESEEKYIRPRTILCNAFSYFCFVTYDEKNEKNVGEMRTFKFQNIEHIVADRYVTDEIFKQEKQGNVFGEYKKDKFIVLSFDRVSGDFFKSSNLFNNPAYEIVDIDKDTIKVKMYYNNLKKEVIKTIQQWMPHIKIDKDEPLKQDIEKIITENYKYFLI